MEILAAISIVVSGVISVVHAVIAYRKSKEPVKDEIWETALRIVTSGAGGMCDADEFARVYEDLKVFKDNGCSLGGAATITALKKKLTDQPQTPE